jgi:hypothetical protein
MNVTVCEGWDAGVFALFWDFVILELQGSLSF